MSTEITITVAADEPAGPLPQLLCATGYVNLDFTLTAPTRRMYEYLSSFHRHLRYVRMHNTLTAHGQGDRFLLQGRGAFGNYGDTRPEGRDRVVGLDGEGRLRFDWSVIDSAYDLIVGQGMDLIVETDFLPTCLRADRESWYLPGDFRLWGQAVAAFVGHLAERYGHERLERWYFEVWNEPDVFAVWNGDPHSFFALYDYMEQAVHGVNPRLKVGGPAVSQHEPGQRLFRAFLEHCSGGVNHVTGRRGTRLDFVSVHCKAGTQEDTNPSASRIFSSLESFAQTLAAFPRFRGLELLNDESGIVWGGNRGVEDASWLNFRNTHYAAGFVCKLLNLYLDWLQARPGVKLGVVGIDDCQLQWETRLFGGQRSQLTPLFRYPSTDLLRKPLFNAYLLCSRLGDRRLRAACREAGFGDKFGCLATARGKSRALMLWNFEDGADDEVNPRSFRVRLRGLPPSAAYKLVQYRIDRRHSNPWAVWASQGRPARPDRRQIRALRQAEGLELCGPVQELRVSGPLTLRVDLPMHAVALLLLVPENRRPPRPPEWVHGLPETGAAGGAQVFLRWSPSREPDFLHYRLWRRETGETEDSLLEAGSSLNTAVYTDMDVRQGRRYEYRVQAVNASGAASRLSEPLEVRTGRGGRR